VVNVGRARLSRTLYTHIPAKPHSSFSYHRLPLSTPSPTTCLTRLPYEPCQKNFSGVAMDRSTQEQLPIQGASQQSVFIAYGPPFSCFGVQFSDTLWLSLLAGFTWSPRASYGVHVGCPVPTTNYAAHLASRFHGSLCHLLGLLFLQLDTNTHRRTLSSESLSGLLGPFGPAPRLHPHTVFLFKLTHTPPLYFLVVCNPVALPLLLSPLLSSKTRAFFHFRAMNEHINMNKADFFFPRFLHFSFCFHYPPITSYYY